MFLSLPAFYNQTFATNGLQPHINYLFLTIQYFLFYWNLAITLTTLQYQYSWNPQ